MGRLGLSIAWRLADDFDAGDHGYLHSAADVPATLVYGDGPLVSVPAQVHDCYPAGVDCGGVDVGRVGTK